MGSLKFPASLKMSYNKEYHLFFLLSLRKSKFCFRKWKCIWKTFLFFFFFPKENGIISFQSTLNDRINKKSPRIFHQGKKKPSLISTGSGFYLWLISAYRCHIALYLCLVERTRTVLPIRSATLTDLFKMLSRIHIERC